jgi:BMFP domain-containing protein YqiC
MRDPSARLLDDLSRVATDAFGLAQGVREEARTLLRSQIERILRDADVVTREEFEVMRDCAIDARELAQSLEARIEALEARLGAGDAAPRERAT